MDYAAALKELQAKKVKDNFIVVKFGYDFQLVLSYKDGLSMIEALKNAEQFNKAYGADRIVALEKGKAEFYIFSYEEYERFKIAGLLNITLDEAERLQNPPEKEAA